MSQAKHSKEQFKRRETMGKPNPLMEARKKLEQAERLRSARQLDRAQKICESILKRYPDYVAALHTLGLVLADKREYAQALPHLVQAAMLNPKDWTTLTVLSGVYLRLGAKVMAVRTLEQALERKPEDASILATLGEIYREDREYEAAADAFRTVLTIDDSLHAARIGLGHACIHLGELAEAAASFEKVMKHHSHSIKVLYSLSQLPASLVNVDVRALLDGVVPDANEDKEGFSNSLAFARAGAFDQAGEHAAAWENLVAANRHLFLQSRDDCRKDVKIQEAVLAATMNSPIAIRRSESQSAQQPLSLFILGPSRSGKTTMEQLVSTVDGVKRGYENQIVENAVRHAFQSAALPTRDQLFELPAALDDLCREHYVEELFERAGAAKVFSNTHPGLINSVLRVAAVIPNVRFIFIKRDLDDISFRIFMKRYRSGNAYAYDFATIRSFVTWYYEMIDILAERLPRISTVIWYENMIADPAAALRSAADLCGLEALDGPLPKLGDDRGCAEPYRALIRAALEGHKPTNRSR